MLKGEHPSPEEWQEGQDGNIQLLAEIWKHVEGCPPCLKKEMNLRIIAEIAGQKALQEFEEGKSEPVPQHLIEWAQNLWKNRLH
ncbi:hypothetical protein A3H65_00435 [Candidatus Giovannonibacteria bacterium RIFCSPLOWO2_02_FULL_45_14]|uniref:Uncharacterized protein n=1 Tax=Candidatus Giovannonibacteria bacterium RIFCSPLOWO2_12_FULL_44_15 TaxID=1798364 RepID=A0A1F5XZ20_9BACT|nr:MAG: hypothetical protein A3C75_00025 [Candidatus Giovannonibacteria bacterium RIFCSPHIGHO2_02_FULL_44_31]OGF91260.1 MAG: hypothetical protein A3H65_00435 [Candidatus Giovannonibacteria bacterium RIFCSPLOWO2_02_FULL_45_14]OGF93112.1 MAG: hypothetical protein A3G54_02520 [Candidatus Giovannonibacteria bacterium RIFCSPLOWO2_12_FULL_44_15]